MQWPCIISFVLPLLQCIGVFLFVIARHSVRILGVRFLLGSSFHLLLSRHKCRPFFGPRLPMPIYIYGISGIFKASEPVNISVCLGWLVFLSFVEATSVAVGVWLHLFSGKGSLGDLYRIKNQRFMSIVCFATVKRHITLVLHSTTVIWITADPDRCLVWVVPCCCLIPTTLRCWQRTWMNLAVNSQYLNSFTFIRHRWGRNRTVTAPVSFPFSIPSPFFSHLWLWVWWEVLILIQYLPSSNYFRAHTERATLFNIV